MSAPIDRTLVDRLAALAPPDCRVAWRPLDDADIDLLVAEEAALVPTAGPVRRREFATGRALLHELLPTRTPILRNPNGAPLFPLGTVGSLAHDRVAALAVVAGSDGYVALGVDVEHMAPGDELDDPELREATLRPDDAQVVPLAAFVIKEAAYKAYSNAGGPMVEPLEVRIEVDGPAFVAHFPLTAGVPSTICGVFAGDAAGWAALATVPR
jgi:4'-phosphopantetheinyl transferase EntD